MSEKFETIETIELSLSGDELLTYALLAHEQDLTLNQWMDTAIRSYLDGHRDKDDGDSKGDGSVVK